VSKRDILLKQNFRTAAYMEVRRELCIKVNRVDSDFMLRKEQSLRITFTLMI